MKFSLNHSIRWSIFISAATFLLACVFSVVSTVVLEGVAWGMGMLVVIVLVLIGIVFDMMGIASAAATEKPFHAIAAKKVRGAKKAIQIVRNADRFSSFCNDVIGDIVGVISGAAAAVVVLKLAVSAGYENTVRHTAVSVVFSAAVSGLMVGGKAVGKSYAIHHANSIVLWVGKVFDFLERRAGISIFGGGKSGRKKLKKASGKRGKTDAARPDQ